MNRVTLSIVFLFILVLLLNLLLWQKPRQSDIIERGEALHKPHYVAHNMRSSLYNDEGQLSHQVFAAQMEHYDLLGFTLFSEPEYTIFSQTGERPWLINARSGTLHDNDRIELEQDVVIKSLDEADFVQTISASYLEIDLKNKTMRSDQPVIIRGKDFIIESNGFEGDLVNRQFELQHHVQTRFNTH